MNNNTIVGDKLRVLALITARGGSKRLPNKNILTLGDKALIGWTLDLALKFFSASSVIVSTDDEKIAATARAHGATVPWLRPAHLASDTASSLDVALHALDWYEAAHGKVDALLLLQPTSPFRSERSIARLLQLFVDNKRRPVVSISPCDSHPLWTFKVESNHLLPYISQAGANMRSQDLPPAYSLNGSLYLISPDDLRVGRTFVPSNTVPLVMADPIEALDIDTAFDWLVAEAYVRTIRTAS